MVAMAERRCLDILAENMRQLRKVKQLTQEELAYRTGFHPYFIGLIERTQRAPSLQSLEKIADALGVSVPEMLQGQRGGKDKMKEALAMEIFKIIEPLEEGAAEAFLSAMKLLVNQFRQRKIPQGLKVAEQRAKWGVRKTRKAQK